MTRAWNTVDANYDELYTYDSLGRLDTKEVRVTTSLGTKSYFDQLTYDIYGRVYESQTLADGLGSIPSIRNIYKSNGYLERIVNVDDNTDLWQALTVDNFGNVTTERTANGRYESIKTYSPTTGLINVLTTQRVGGSLHRNLSYNWDTLGNLRSRTDGIAGKTETFGYDTINRITSSQITGLALKTFSYDDFGNITSKGGNSYTYGGTCSGITAGPHAVTNRGGVSYCYDKNGNQTSGDGRTITYSLFNKPVSVTKGTHTTDFDYSPNRNRYKREDRESGTLKETKVTASGLEVIFKTVNGNATTEVRRYVGNALMKYIYTGSSSVPTKSTDYIFKDHLGSTDTILTPNGSADNVTKVNFGVFGGRRYGFNLQGLTSTQLNDILVITDKGYTGHEQMDDMGLIHMNGRVYDPKLGRFMSADPHIQAPTDTQSLNRYSYVLNNPMSATDPSGYFFKKYWRALVSIAIAVFLPQAAFMDFGFVGNGAITGFISGGVSTGTLKGAFSGALTGSLFGKLHGFDPGVGKVIAHGFVGGIGSVLNGGKFGHGFASAGMTESLNKSGLFKNGAKGWDRVKNAVKAAVVGGTVSVATGGKFQNGAITGAFSRLLNADAEGGENLDRHENEISFDHIESDPDGDGVDNISFENDNPNNPHTDRAVKLSLAIAVEDSSNNTGLSFNVNSSTGGHENGTPHFEGRAVDINRVNSTEMFENGNDTRSNVSRDATIRLQVELMSHPQVQKVYGPYGAYQKINNNWYQLPRQNWPALYNQHRNHIHVQVE